MTLRERISALSLILDRIDPERAVTIVRDALLRAEMVEAMERVPVPVVVPSSGRITTERVMFLLQCADEHIIDLKKIGALEGIRTGKSNTFDEQEVNVFIENMKGEAFEEDIRAKLRKLRAEKIARRKAKKVTKTKLRKVS